jgi:transposase
MLPAGEVRIYLACGVTDMRKGFHSLAAQVQTALSHDPYSGALYIFRGRRGDLIKILFWDRQGMCLYAKKLDRGRFMWPQAKDGVVSLTMAQLSMLLESSTGAPQLCESDRFSGWRKRCRLKSRSWPLRRELAQREAIIAVRDAELAEAAVVKARLTPALLEIEQIKLQLATLRWQRYGQSSERLDSDIAQLEMRLKDCEEGLGEQIAARPEPERHHAFRPREKSGRKPLRPHLPREVVVHEPEIVCGCDNCDPARLAKLGEIVTEVLEKIPARLKVIRHVRPKYACRLCERVFQAPAPELPIEKGRPGPGLLAHIAISKYCGRLPLYRQPAILAREGVEIDRTTMAEWMGHVAWWLRPLAALIGGYVMAQSVMWTDDTPIRTLAPGTGKTRLTCARFLSREGRQNSGKLE